MTKYAITGATGQLGASAAAELAKKKDVADITAVVRDKSKAQSLIDQGIDVRIADYTDSDSLQDAFKGIDKVLLISSNEVGKRFEHHKNVIDAAKNAGVSHIVYTSLTQADTSNLVLADEHKLTENYLKESGITYSVARNNWYHENQEQLFNSARNNGVIIGAAKEGKVASASRQDYAQGAVELLIGQGHENKIYEFTGDSAWDYNELAKTFSEILDKEVVYNNLDQEELTKTLTGFGLDEMTAGFVAKLDDGIANGSLELITNDLSELIGRPTTPLKEAFKA